MRIYMLALCHINIHAVTDILANVVCSGHRDWVVVYVILKRIEFQTTYDPHWFAFWGLLPCQLFKLNTSGPGFSRLCDQMLVFRLPRSQRRTLTARSLHLNIGTVRITTGDKD
ncbi:hypothetical protein HO173_001869 [Letharia columbiana]|uniref:Secreted protein n=1 Tax=Letharia columbiana TaxID=112416 RepID=A0A8H6G464_9LECA|nr:uncharacterized protein HO173_001869 [Letharia columbiana]KAF6240258.1 hypothetical protein HO173_001869 [Letharia columbiana]